MRRLSPALGVCLLAGLASSALAWTDDPLTAGTTKVRKVHIDELRAAVASQRSNYGFSAPAWTDATITAGTTLIRKVHIDELRDKLDDINAVYDPLCAAVPAAPAWGAITAGSTLLRAADITQLRSASDAIGTCRNCCGLCKSCNGAACVNQSSAQDLWADCPTATCKTGNCDGAGACGNLASGTEGGEGGGAACAVCQDCNAAGGCVNVANATADVGCAIGFYCSGLQRRQITGCNGSGSCVDNLVQTCTYGCVSGACTYGCTPDNGIGTISYGGTMTDLTTSYNANWATCKNGCATVGPGRCAWAPDTGYGSSCVHYSGTGANATCDGTTGNCAVCGY